MTRWQRNGLWVALIHLAIVGSVGAKFAVDRATYPRAWVRTVPIDPDMPIRGRYVRLNAVVEYDATPNRDEYNMGRVRLQIRDGKLVGIKDGNSRHHLMWRPCGTNHCWILSTPLTYFIPEHIPDPAQRAPGEELWVEISLPPKGAPRPVRLGVMRDGALTPLDLR